MARLPRIDIPGIAQHVVTRGNDRGACFFREVDYATYRAWLFEAVQRHHCALHAFALMTNHVHLLMTGRVPGAVGATIQALGRRYVRHINERYQRTGTLFEGRYKASLVEGERYGLACMRYIELNPVRAAMVRSPAEYRWSSFRANAGIGPSAGLEPHESYAALGTSHAERIFAYRQIFETEIDAADIDAIRLHTQKDCVLGSPRFQAQIAGIVGRRTALPVMGRPAQPALADSSQSSGPIKLT
jgi:putative transposase